MLTKDTIPYEGQLIMNLYKPDNITPKVMFIIYEVKTVRNTDRNEKYTTILEDFNSKTDEVGKK